MLQKVIDYEFQIVQQKIRQVRLKESNLFPYQLHDITKTSISDPAEHFQSRIAEQDIQAPTGNKR